MEQLELAQQLELEEQSLQQALLESSTDPGCKVLRPTDEGALKDMETLHQEGFSKEQAIWAVKVSRDLFEARCRATNRDQAEKALRAREAVVKEVIGSNCLLPDDKSMPPPAPPVKVVKPAGEAWLCATLTLWRHSRWTMKLFKPQLLKL